MKTNRANGSARAYRPYRVTYLFGFLENIDERLRLSPILSDEERDGFALFARPPGSADSMDVLFHIPRKVVIDHPSDVLDVETARSDI